MESRDIGREREVLAHSEGNLKEKEAENELKYKSC
jgi:hypothetical protein